MLGNNNDVDHNTYNYYAIKPAHAGLRRFRCIISHFTYAELKITAVIGRYLYGVMCVWVLHSCYHDSMNRICML